MLNNINMLYLFGFLSFNTSAVDQLDSITDEICLCLEAPHQQVEKELDLLLVAQDAKDLAGITHSQNLIMELISASKLCLESYRQRYPDIAKDITMEEQALSLLDQKCPDPLLVYRSKTENVPVLQENSH